MPTSIIDIAALILVGAFWGCTNPLLRQGSLKAAESEQQKPPVDTPSTSNAATAAADATTTSWTKQLRKFRHVRVWLPYAVNQSGSLLFYVALSQTDLSLAVPIANALALVFSVVTTFLIGEPLHQPLKTVAGAALVVGGVALCSWEATNHGRFDKDND